MYYEVDKWLRLRMAFHQPIKNRKTNIPPVTRSEALYQELEPLKLQGSGKLSRHTRSSSIDERKKDRSGTAPESLLRELGKEKAKEATRKKDRKRGHSEHFANRLYTLRPPASSETTVTVAADKKQKHKRTRSSADDLARVVNKDRHKESLRTCENSIALHQVNK